MKAYSADLRHRVLAAVDRGMPRPEVAATFDVSLATIKRWIRRQRTTGSCDVLPRPGRPARLGAALDAGIVEQLQAHPDATLAEHCTIWQDQTGQAISSATLRRAITRAGWTRKKRV